MRKTRFAAVCLATVIGLVVFTSFAIAQDDSRIGAPKLKLWSTNPFSSVDDGSWVHVQNHSAQTACAITWATSPVTGLCIGGPVVTKVGPFAVYAESTQQLFNKTGVTDPSAYFNITVVPPLVTSPLANPIGGTTPASQTTCPVFGTGTSNPLAGYIRGDGQLRDPEGIQSLQDRISVQEKFYPFGPTRPPTGANKLDPTRYTLDEVNFSLRRGFQF